MLGVPCYHCQRNIQKEIAIPNVKKSTRAMQPTLAAVLSALGDETRLHIVRQLADRGEVPCGQFNLSLPKSTLSHHFNVLISAGIIARRREGTIQFNRLRRAELNRNVPGLLDSILRARPSTR
jgi:DNA-binding transcriptional ArsR family regulator